MKLTIELVPSTCWYSNLRSELSETDWDRIRVQVFRDADNLCEICGGRGPKWPVEAHEIWLYNDETLTQTLERVAALCPNCHSCKHFGLAQVRGRGAQAKKHLSKVNGWKTDEADWYIAEVFEKWVERSSHEWDLNISKLSDYGVPVPERPRGLPGLKNWSR